LAKRVATSTEQLPSLKKTSPLDKAKAFVEKIRLKGVSKIADALNKSITNPGDEDSQANPSVRTGKSFLSDRLQDIKEKADLLRGAIAPPNIEPYTWHPEMNVQDKVDYFNKSADAFVKSTRSEYSTGLPPGCARSGTPIGSPPGSAKKVGQIPFTFGNFNQNPMRVDGRLNHRCCLGKTD
jgi:hypothetical protein